jgi:hypothetical protein
MTVLLDAPDVYGHATFCDDIRIEADGKLTYVGVYHGTMIVHVPFPVVIPKFCIEIAFFQKKSIFDPNMGLRIFMPGDAEDKPSIQADVTEIAEGAVKQQVAQGGALRLESESESELVIQARTHMQFAPFTINEPGLIKIRILRQDKLHRLGSMRVIPPPPVAT